MPLTPFQAGINPDTLGDLKLVHPGDALSIKRKLLASFDAAEKLMSTLPPETLGAFFLNREGSPARGKVFDTSWVPHFGSFRGAWPTIVQDD